MTSSDERGLAPMPPLGDGCVPQSPSRQESYEPDYEVNFESPCPACGNASTHWRRCSELSCDDGFLDEYEDDLVNYAPGDYVACGNCKGTGIEHWCPACGADVNEVEEVECLK